MSSSLTGSLKSSASSALMDQEQFDISREKKKQKVTHIPQEYLSLFCNCAVLEGKRRSYDFPFITLIFCPNSCPLVVLMSLLDAPELSQSSVQLQKLVHLLSTIVLVQTKLEPVNQVSTEAKDVPDNTLEAKQVRFQCAQYVV